MERAKSGFLVFGMLALGGCVFGENQQFFSTQGPRMVTGTGTQQDVFQVAAGGMPKIDVLFCIDNSASMSDNQRILADSFGGFIGKFVSAGLDFHIGVISTDVDSSLASVWRSRLPGYPGANRGLLLSRFPGERFLTSDSPDLVRKFEDNARLGTSGSYREQCLNSFIYTLDPESNSAGGWNEGFFRGDSLSAFVVVSDENEDIQDGESVSSRVERLRSHFQGIRGPASTGARFDFIINEQAPDPGRTPVPGSIQYYPGRYYEASRLLSGHNHDITKDFSADLLQMSEGMIQQASHEFTLSRKPGDPGKLQVFLDSRLLTLDDPDGFNYHSERNSVELQGTAARSAPGTLLQVFYDPI